MKEYMVNTIKMNISNTFNAQIRKRSIRFLRLSSVFIALAFGFLTFSGCSDPLSSDAVRQFQKGLDEFAQSQKPDDYLKAANTYETLINQGVKSGIVYYNLGNAYVMAGDKPRALAAYRQAIPYMPSNPYLLDNIQSVGGKIQPPTLFENLFFWQNWISFPIKSILATTLMTITCVIVLAFIAFRKSPILYLGIVFLLLTICAFVSVNYDYQRFVNTQRGVITEAKVIGRKGDADTYSPALTQPLTSGAEFIVSQRRGDWILINLDESHECWIPVSSAIIY